ncbi:MAG: hypothetical protein ACTSYA_03230 [Candidatus Kariarchaeaceae archaeon]
MGLTTKKFEALKKTLANYNSEISKWVDKDGFKITRGRDLSKQEDILRFLNDLSYGQYCNLSDLLNTYTFLYEKRGQKSLYEFLNTITDRNTGELLSGGIMNTRVSGTYNNGIYMDFVKIIGIISSSIDRTMMGFGNSDPFKMGGIAAVATDSILSDKGVVKRANAAIWADTTPIDVTSYDEYCKLIQFVQKLRVKDYQTVTNTNHPNHLFTEMEKFTLNYLYQMGQKFNRVFDPNRNAYRTTKSGKIYSMFPTLFPSNSVSTSPNIDPLFIEHEINQVMNSRNILELIANSLEWKNSKGKFDVNKVKESLKRLIYLAKPSSFSDSMTPTDIARETGYNCPRFNVFAVYLGLLNFIST